MRTKRYRRRQRRRPLFWLVIIAAAIAAGWFWFQWQCWGVQTTVTQVELSGLPVGFDGLRIAHLSDIHGHEYGENSAELIEKISATEGIIRVIRIA